MWTLAIIIAIVALIVVLGFAIHAAFSGAVEFWQRPREPMEYCTKHSYFRRQDCILIKSSPDGLQFDIPGPVALVCPVCIYDAMMMAKKGELGSNGKQSPTVSAK